MNEPTNITTKIVIDYCNIFLTRSYNLIKLLRLVPRILLLQESKFSVLLIN